MFFATLLFVGIELIIWACVSSFAVLFLQGCIDPEVKQALVHIIKLRSEEATKK